MKTIQYFVDLILYCEELEKYKKFVASKQLLQLGTSIGANLHEAQNVESKIDFIQKN